MPRLSDNPKIQTILGIIFYSTFFIVSTIPVPFLLIAEIFLVPKNRPFFWRVACCRILSFHFKMFGLKVRRIGHMPSDTKKVHLYISNHPSIMDPAYLLSLMGPEVITLARPHRLQMFPFTIWFPKMEVVEVTRDNYDAVHCSKIADRHAALDRLINFAINEKKPLLIFPEGHVESGKKVHYIHSGAARVAIRAKIQIVPMMLINMDHIFIDKIKFRPGVIYIKMHRPLKPPAVSHELPYRHAVKVFTKKIAEIMYGMLPERVIPKDLYDKNPERIGVFVDIDRTLYKYYSQQVFLKYLQRHGKVSYWVTGRIIGYLFFEKIGLLPHDVLMKQAYRFAKGWNEAHLTKIAEQFFQEEIIKDLDHDLMVVMKDHVKRGHQIFLISEVVPPLARQFKLFFEARDMGLTSLQKKHGEYTGMVNELCYGDAKARHVKRLAKKYNIDLQKSYSYGDSPADIPMLKLVKHKIAVRPKPELKHEAILHDWHIMH